MTFPGLPYALPRETVVIDSADVARCLRLRHQTEARASALVDSPAARRCRRQQERLADPRRHRFFPAPATPNACWYCGGSPSQHRPGRWAALVALVRRVWGVRRG